ncbi:MAG: type IV pilin [Halococcoides sp.]
MVGSRPSEDRAVSELTSIVAIVVIGMVLLAVVGVNVLDADSENEGPDVTFSYEYLEPQSMLLVEFESGEPIPAGQLEITGSNGEATWAALNDQMNESTPVGPGDVVNVGPDSAYNGRVTPSDAVEIRYLNETGAATTVSHWNGTD